MKDSQEMIELKKLLSIYEHILDKMNEGVHVIDGHGKSVVYNRKMTELESMNAHDVLGKNLSEVFQFPSGQESTLLQSLRKGMTNQNVRQTYYNDKGKEITTINNTYPIVDDNRIIGAIEIANDITKMERLIRENILEQEKRSTRFTFESIIGNSEAIRDVIEDAKRAARTSSSILVVGETGTGKELFVQSIHNASLRSGAPFISQNCAALPDSLIEGLLFGTTRGAFTGAIERPGLFEQAEGGTLFLDEINSLSLPLQAKLLRALQEKSIRRLGDTKDRPINVRVIAAINEDPIEAISNQRIRKDLYYRLGVVTLFIPPLRERKEDILPLADHFIQKYNQLFQMEVHGVSDEAKQFFLEYDWPGNVRELQHMIEGSMNLMDDDKMIDTCHLPTHHTRRRTRGTQEKTHPSISAEKQLVSIGNHDGVSLKHQLEQFEKTYIRTILEKHGGNISRAARELGLSRQNLQYRLRKHEIKPVKGSSL